MLARVFALLALLACPAMAATPDAFRCATSGETEQREHERAQWLRQRAAGARPLRENGGDPSIVTRGNVVIVAADDSNVQSWRPVDLQNLSIDLRSDGEGYVAQSGPLAYEDDLGTKLALDLSADEPYATYRFAHFAFPLGTAALRDVSINMNLSVTSEKPPLLDLLQWSELDAAAWHLPMIAPLLTTIFVQRTPPDVYVRDTPDAVTITWRSTKAPLDVQVTLFRDGRIRFSYRDVSGIAAGALLVTSGTESWRRAAAAIVSVTDPPRDNYPATPPALAGLSDIVSFRVSRLAGSSLFEARIETREPYREGATPYTAIVQLDDAAGHVAQFSFGVGKTGALVYQRPGGQSEADSPAARFEGNALVLDFLQEDFAGLRGPIHFHAAIFVGPSAGDFTNVTVANPEASTVTIGPGRAVSTDFSALAFATALRGPVLETFTLGALSPERVWEQLRSAYGLRDDAFDGVAMYQNFLTDLSLYASAYATRGHAAVKGVYPSDDTAAVSPNLMHMNKIGAGANSPESLAAHTLLHEFGHRWLFSPLIDENGQRTKSLNPDGGHPAQWVDTRAAFNVLTADDYSVMGGTKLAQNSDGTFTTSAREPNGYSWLDLYLMGLAAPAEVTPFFYLRDTSPPLGSAYYAPANTTVTGTRVPVTIDQVTRALGPRQPAYPDGKRSFHVLFVLVADPRLAVSDEELAAMERYRASLERNFAIATGGRADVTTAFTPPIVPPRRRSARH